jgi:hypothetical protein
MATLQDVNSAMQGEQKPKDKPKVEPTFNIGVAPTVTTKQEFVIFKLLKKKRGRTYVDGICDAVLNPTTKKRERIWLLNGADSIWQSELLELLKDKEYVKRNRRSLIFEDGVCRIRVTDDRALEFARANTNNVGKANVTNGGKFAFREYDPEAEQKEKYKVQSTKIEMILKAKDMEVGKMRKLASFLGVIFYDDLGQPKTDEGIRTELMIKADNDPVGFARYLDSKEVDIAYMVKRAILDAKIDLTGQSGNAIWANGKGFIAKIPSTRKPYEYLTELAMTNSDEGKAFLEQLQTVIT